MRQPISVVCQMRPPSGEPCGRIPRVARLLALAVRYECLIADGTVQNYAELAYRGQVSRARMSQLMRLIYLAPDLQQTILFWPPIQQGRDPITLGELLPIAALLDWNDQRRWWRKRFPPANAKQKKRTRVS